MIIKVLYDQIQKTKELEIQIENDNTVEIEKITIEIKKNSEIIKTYKQ